MNKQKPQHVGNITFAYDVPGWSSNRHLYLVLKEPKNAEDKHRARERVGIGKWMPAGGEREQFDRSHKHGTRRELFEESGSVWRVPLGTLRKVGVLESYRSEEGYLKSFERAQLKWVVHLYETIIPEWCRDMHRPSKGIVETRWFPTWNLPWNGMMEDNRLWVPQIIDGEQLRIRLLLHYRHKKVTAHDITREKFS